MLQTTGVVTQIEYGASSQHSSAALLIARGLYDDLHSFAELEQRISKLGDENTKIVGDAFEIFVEACLATHQKLQVDTVWLVGQVPNEIREQLNLPKDVKGIDGVFRTRTGLLVPYQVKFRSNRAYLTYTEIAPFLGLTERAVDRIVFTNSNELAQDVKNRDAMRTVRGIDFDDLTEDDFRAICGWLRREPVAIPKPIPYPYQTIALETIAETFATSNRAHVVMACGTGKTLLALWAVEQIKPKTVLVLVPSLTLLQQTLDEWSRHNSWGNDFSYICVCSDPTVALKDENDPITFHRSDADFRVDTDPIEVRRFLRSTRTSIKVIFSTYQSSDVVSQAMRGLVPLDIAIFDEAHKTTGPKGGLFAHCLSDDNIKIRRRLFLTATPRHYDIRHRDREGDFRIVSMDDETIYGPRAYTLTFGSAAHQGIICNYKIIISVVDGQEVNDFALKHGITLVKADLIGARWVANQIAVERAIEKTGAIRGITFHSRVSSAKEFSADTSRGIQQWLPDFSIFHVNGTQRSSERKQLIRSFRNATKALITNARCLTEGIDVPAVDMVVFIDPRQSRVDIAQAMGRAMRKPSGSDKTIGYVVVPLFLERKKDETLEEALQRSSFDNVADILNAMQEQDDDLVQIIREIQEEKGEKDVFNPRGLADKIEVVGQSIELSTLRSNIFVEAIDRVGVTWDEMYGCLKAYKEREGHCRVPARHIENGQSLGGWVQHQRSTRKVMSAERLRRLDEIGFVSSAHQEDWNEGFSHLKAYRQREGHCRVPLAHKENGYELGRWVNKQRTKKEEMSTERRTRLQTLGFIWDILSDQWEEGFTHLMHYKDREGHCRVPALHLENRFRLGSWVRMQRVSQATMSVERKRQLENIGILWDVRSEQWEQGFSYLQAYKARVGHCRVPDKHRENGYGLGIWVGVQRGNTDKLTAERQKRLDGLGFVWRVTSPIPEDRRQRLDALGFEWGILGDKWEQGFKYLQAYEAREGHCRVPASHKERGYLLGRWVNKQRTRRDTLSTERLQRLDDVRFIWNARSDKWQEAFEYLQCYKDREGHCIIPRGHKEGQFPLGLWAHTQRQSRKRLSEGRRASLDGLGFVWNSLADQWSEGLEYLKMYKKRERHCRVPPHHVESGFRLGTWVSNQRHNRKIPPERRKQLDELGFVWNPFEGDWNDGFAYLKAYNAREGNCRVPNSHSEDGYPLGTWVGKQRSNKKLSTERRKQLAELGVIWDVKSEQWEVGFGYLKIYKEREGHCRIPKSHIENGYPLGVWVNGQRQKKRTMPSHRRKRLDTIRFIWDGLTDQWQEGLNYLRNYNSREGHSRVPSNHIENGFPLGTWVHHRRRSHDKLPAERRQQLDELEFVWKPFESDWTIGFNHLTEYKAREGHCAVPYSHNEDGYPLGSWIRTQRNRKKKMPVKRRKQLDKLGFEWKER